MVYGDRLSPLRLSRHVDTKEQTLNQICSGHNRPEHLERACESPLLMFLLIEWMNVLGILLNPTTDLEFKRFFEISVEEREEWNGWIKNSRPQHELWTRQGAITQRNTVNQRRVPLNLAASVTAVGSRKNTRSEIAMYLSVLKPQNACLIPLGEQDIWFHMAVFVTVWDDYASEIAVAAAELRVNEDVSGLKEKAVTTLPKCMSHSKKGLDVTLVHGSLARELEHDG